MTPKTLILVLVPVLLLVAATVLATGASGSADVATAPDRTPQPSAIEQGIGSFEAPPAHDVLYQLPVDPTLASAC